MTYSENFKINKNFQTSINLELDIGKIKKIEEYIPTSDICDVLKKYIRSCFSNAADRATTLVGPYGKGKSHILLVLTYLLGEKKSTSPTYKALIEKIGAIDPELKKLIKTYNTSHKRLLPVIINSNYDDLNQAFLLALNEALEREKIEDVIPNTVYDVCLEIINNWEEDASFKKIVKEKCKKKKINVEQVKAGLKLCSKDSYNDFTDLYSCMTGGMIFNPLVNTDVVKIYKDVNHELAELKYSGIFIIFDEFSKFIDNQDENLSKSLKIIQDFGELATRSTEDEQLHLCCVTHKSVNLYGKRNDKSNPFKAIEGRFKEIKFNRTLEGNYKLISSAIKSSAQAEKIANKYISKHSDFYRALSEFSPFLTDIDFNEFAKSCYPLNPITVYALIQLSELVAQNERTLFTFLSDTDDNSFNSFLHKENDGLFNVDKIYDYFSELFRKDDSEKIRNIWFRTESILSRIEDQQQKQIIKSLAIIFMINNPEQLPADEHMLYLATGLEYKEINLAVTKLIDEYYLRKSIINNSLSFSTLNSKAIEDKILVIEQTKSKSFALEKVLDEINEERFVLPRKYNAEKKITRFYRTYFITEKQLSTLKSFNVFKEQGYADGLILNLIRTSMSDDSIKQRMDEIKDPVAIVKYPSEMIDEHFSEILLRYAALTELLRRGNNDDLATSEVGLLLDETKDDIETLLDDDFNEESNFYSSIDREQAVPSFKDLLSIVMDKAYPKDIVFNNELINKNVVSLQYQKAANNIIDDLLNGSEGKYSETSPEATIRTSVINNLEQDDVREIINDIKRDIRKAEKHKLLIKNIINKYTAIGYGLRKGIILILIAKAISELSDNIILSNSKQFCG